MPAEVDKLHDELISDPEFYKEKSEKQQDAIAWAIAWKQFNKGKKKRKSKAFVETFVKIAEELDTAGNYRAADLLDRTLSDD
jgi:O-succinylbenzoate synthase